jgi:hypothetical protein
LQRETVEGGTLREGALGRKCDPGGHEARPRDPDIGGPATAATVRALAGRAAAPRNAADQRGIR